MSNRIEPSLPFENDPAEVAEIQRLRDLIEANLGDSPFRVKGVQRGTVGEWQLILEPKPQKGEQI